MCLKYANFPFQHYRWSRWLMRYFSLRICLVCILGSLRHKSVTYSCHVWLLLNYPPAGSISLWFPIGRLHRLPQLILFLGYELLHWNKINTFFNNTVTVFDCGDHTCKQKCEHWPGLNRNDRNEKKRHMDIHFVPVS